MSTGGGSVSAVITSIYPDPHAEITDLFGYLLAAHRPGGRRLMLNMIASIDGAISWDGRSSRLGDDDDREFFHALRATCDAVLVGAGTVRSETYHPIRFPESFVARRRSLGLSDAPELAIVSQSLDLDPFAPVFSDPDRRPLVLTGADAPPTGELADRADLVVAGETGVDPPNALDALFDRGHEVILCEGGPTLNGRLVQADLVDEMNLTISPIMLAGDSGRLARGGAPYPLAFRLERLLAGDRMLFVRYLREGR